MIINILIFGCSVKYDGMNDPKLVLDSGHFIYRRPVRRRNLVEPSGEPGGEPSTED